MKRKTHSLQTTRHSIPPQFRYFGSPFILGFFLIQSATAAITTWTGTGGDDNWATAGNWDVALPTGNDAVFAAADATGTKGTGGTPNNIISANTSVGTVRYTNLETTGYHTTEITAGNTLTIVGGNTGSTLATASPALFVNSPTTDTNDIVYATILGDGNLFINNAGANMHVGQGTTNTGAASTTRRATLDMSGLNQFQATVGRIIMCQQTLVGNRSAGTILLAKNNIIDLTNATTPGLLLGDLSSNNGVSQIIELGITNSIRTDFGITVGGRKGNGIIRYNSNIVDPGAGTVTFRSRNGTGRQGQWRIGDNSGQGGGGTLATGIVDFSLHGAVDALVDVVTLGRGTGPHATQLVSNATPSQGTLTFDKGTVNVNQLILGIQPAIDGGGGQGTLNVDGTGNLIVNSNLTMGRYFGKNLTTAAHKALGLLNIGSISGGGAVTISGDITCGNAGGNKITLTAGSLALGGKVGDDSVDGDAPLETLQLNGGALTFNFGATPNPTGSRVKVTNLNVPNSVTIGITGASLSPGTIKLIEYTNFDQATQFANLTLGLPARVVANLVNNTSTSSVDLEIISVSTNKWSGAVNGDWDIDTTLNWALSPGNTPSKYLQAGTPGEAVTFDDTAIGTKTVNLTTALSPGAILVDSASTYTFNGTGAISGPTGIIKRGAGSLVIENSGVNNFSGAVSIEAGKIQTGGGNDRLPVNATVTLADVATAELDLNNSNQTLLSLNGGGATGGNLNMGSGALTLTGAGSHAGIISGSGALTKSGAGTQVLSGANLYSGGTTISGGRLAVANTSGSGLGSGPVVVQTAGVLAIGAGEAPGSITAPTITNNGRVAFNSNEDFTFSNLLEGIGVVAKENVNNTVTLATANPYSGFTTITGGGLRVTHKDALGTFVADPLNPTVGFNTNISNDPSSRLVLEGGITLQEPLTVATKGGAVTSPAVLNVSGENTLAGPIELTTGGSVWNFQSDDGKLTITGTMTNIATINTRTIRLAGDALGDIQSNLTNSAGNLSLTAVSKEDVGTWTLAGDNTNTGPTSVNGGTLLITGTHTSSAITVAFGATLGGTGTVGLVSSTGAIAPGVGIGTLKAGETTLNGVLDIELSGASSDLLSVTGTLALNASKVNITGMPVAASYTLATATTAITGTPTLETDIPGYELVNDGTSLKLNSTSPGTPFNTWAGLNNLAGNDALPGADVENDGLENLLEFVLGGNPKANDTPSVRPVIVNTANSITLTFKRSDASELQPVAVRVQVSADLATWNPADEITIGATGGTGPNGATYTVDETGDFDTIVVTIPKNSASTKFARVKAVIP